MVLVTMTNSVVTSRGFNAKGFHIKISEVKWHHSWSLRNRSSKYLEGVEFTFFNVKVAGGSGE